MKLNLKFSEQINITKAPVKPLEVTENGIYESENGGFNPVTVNVQGAFVPDGYYKTEDATATADDIREGKTAYTKDGKIAGTGKRSLKELLDFSKTARNLFYSVQVDGCDKYIEFDDTSEVTEFDQMFYGAKATYLPEFDTSKGVGFSSFCRDTLITTIPLYDMRNGQRFTQMFTNDKNLKRVPQLDFRSATNVNKIFEDCVALEEVFIKNIKLSIQVGSGNSYGHLLTLESLIHLIGELRDTGNPLTLTIGNINREKLANVYVKPIEITDEMRAEDDLIDEKLPFVVCESTDEGACLIKDYVFYKNWELQ